MNLFLGVLTNIIAGFLFNTQKFFVDKAIAQMGTNHTSWKFMASLVWHVGYLQKVSDDVWRGQSARKYISDSLGYRQTPANVVKIFKMSIFIHVVWGTYI